MVSQGLGFWGVSIGNRLRNCHHIGRVGTYAELAAEHGLISQL